MNNFSENTSGDGRVAVLLLFLTCILIINFAKVEKWPLLAGNGNNHVAICLSIQKPDMLVVVPAEDKSKLQEDELVPARFSPFFFQKVPINSADKDMLMTVQGVGPLLAEDIMEYRRQFGPLKDSEELQNIHGIGPKLAAIFSTAFTFDKIP